MVALIDLDTWLTFSIYSGLSSPVLDLLSFSLAILFSFAFLASFLFFIYFIKRDKRVFLLLFTVLVAAVAVSIMKVAIARPRPLLNQPYMPLLDASGYSFPSGHATLSFAVVTAFFYYNKKYGAVGYLTAGLAAFSRVYVAAHYVSDVIAGAALGILVALFCIRFSHVIYRVESRIAAHLSRFGQSI